MRNYDYSQRGLTSGRRPVVKIIAESLSQHDEKHVVPTTLSVEKGRKKKTSYEEYCKCRLLAYRHLIAILKVINLLDAF
jgi:hypothetical protein